MSKVWFLVILCAFLASLIVQLLLEYFHRSDSIGIWYTIYSAIIYTVVIVAVIKLIATITQHFRE